MPIHKMKSVQFAAPTFEEWKETAEKTLKSKPFNTLVTKTAEGIDLQPLYTKQDAVQQRVTKPAFGWTIAQLVSAGQADLFLQQAEESLERGNEAIAYSGVNPFDWSEEQLQQLAQLLVEHPVLFTGIQKNDPILQAFTYVKEEQRDAVKGIFISSEAQLPETFTKVRTAGADLWDVHHEGADAVTELALALAKAAQLAEQAESFEAFTESFYVRFAADTHFFMEIAKFRAFRVLWKLFNEAYGREQVKQVPLLAVTSLRSYSKLDPYVNLLRGGNAAFSAVLGGADWLTVLPHDVLTGSTVASSRYARNIQLILKEETHINHVLDPAGGSYFIESLTADLVREAWSRFLTVEEDGGYDAFVQSGALQQLFAEREKEIANGRKTLIGTNVYAELTDVDFTNGLLVQRLAEPFEALRAKDKATLPKAALLNFGALKDYKPRADFVSGFLAVGGMEALWSPSFESIEQALNWISQEQPDYAVICSAAGEAEQIITDFLASYTGSAVIDAAGKYDAELSEKWKEDGLNGFVSAGQDKISKLNAIAAIKGGRSVE